MNLMAAQTELVTQADTDRLDAMIEEVCRLRHEAGAACNKVLFQKVN